MWHGLLRAINKAFICACNVTHSHSSLCMDKCQIHITAKSTLWFTDYCTLCANFATKKDQGKVVYINVWLWLKIYGGFRWTGNDVISSRCIQSFLFLVAKIESALQATETTFCLKMDVKTIWFIYIFCGDFFSLHFPLSAHCYLLKLSVPWQAGQIKGIRYHLVFFLNGYTCGTSGSKPDSLLTFLCSILCSHGNCCMFGRKLLKAVEKERESLGREHKGRVREGGRESEQALSSWPTSSVIMPWSRNEAFGSTPGFWEQRCELLMLAVGPAWHPSPFPSSPCLGRLPDLPPPPPAGTAKRIRIKRETCFSLASCSGPMTSPLQPPAPRFQPPSIFFPFAVDPPFYLNSTILYLYQSRLFKMPNSCFYLCFCNMWHIPMLYSCIQGTLLNHSEKSIKHFIQNWNELTWQTDALTLSFRAPQTVCVP